MSVRFGTDGVRGLANVEITAEVALAVGRAAASCFDVPRVVIGRDTRRSGSMLAAACAAGACAEGARATSLGVVPTPGVAFAAARADAVGVVVSASHNPAPDNGLKLFAPGGRKLGDDEQAAVEAAVEAALARDPAGAAGRTGGTPVGAGVGEVVEDPELADEYAASVVAAVEGRSLEGLSVVVDAANGAAAGIAPAVLGELGAQVEAIAAQPDGTNINDRCGSTHPELLAERVVATGADLGVALDGDADRMLAVDHTGRVVDGDELMALFALDLRGAGRLAHDTLVVTVMSNLGLRRAMADRGITIVETPVGDRHVLEALSSGGYSLGGEQSGHLVFTDHSTTGDGVLSAALLCDLVTRRGGPLSELVAGTMTRLPQVLVNVALADPAPDIAERIVGELAAVRDELGPDGRVLVRPSGTEPVARVMVEADDEATARSAADRLAAAVRAAGGA